MNKQKLTLIVATAALSVASLPTYAEGWYLSVNAGHTESSSEVYNDGTNGAGTPKSDIESDAIVGLAVGFEISPAFHLELEYSTASYNTDSSRSLGSDTRALDEFSIDAKIDADILMLNASYQFENSSKFTPYIKGGVGYTFYDIKGDLYVGSFGGTTAGGLLPATFSYTGDGNEFSYFAGLGVSMALSEKVALGLEYRHSYLGNIATDYDANGDRLQTDMTTNNILLSLSYQL
jgi:opacity protein-like surface antigen